MVLASSPLSLPVALCQHTLDHNALGCLEGRILETSLQVSSLQLTHLFLEHRRVGAPNAWIVITASAPSTWNVPAATAGRCRSKLCPRLSDRGSGAGAELAGMKHSADSSVRKALGRMHPAKMQKSSSLPSIANFWKGPAELNRHSSNGGTACYDVHELPKAIARETRLDFEQGCPGNASVEVDRSALEEQLGFGPTACVQRCSVLRSTGVVPSVRLQRTDCWHTKTSEDQTANASHPHGAPWPAESGEAW